MRYLRTGHTLHSPGCSRGDTSLACRPDHIRTSHQPSLRSHHTCCSAPVTRQRTPFAAQYCHIPQTCRAPPQSCRQRSSRSRRQLHRKQWLRRSAPCKCHSTLCQAARSGAGPGPYGDWPPGAHWSDVSGDEESGLPDLDSITSSEVDNQVPEPAESVSQAATDERLHHIQVPKPRPKLQANTDKAYSRHGGVLYPPAERSQIKESWGYLMRWSASLRKNGHHAASILEETDKVVVFGGGSFGTAMASALARQKSSLEVVMLMRDPYVCRDINSTHMNARYLQGYELPPNVCATTSAAEAIRSAQYAIHAVPVQHSRDFLHSIKDLLPPEVPIVSVSKGLEAGTGHMMSEIIPSALGRRQPCAFLSGPSFAKEVMTQCPTGVVAASKDMQLAQDMQSLFASSAMRVNTTTDVVGVEICGALKNVLAIAAGIVEGLQLGHNAMAALISQGCSEIRWLAEKMGAKSATVSGLSGLGDIMLTCYGSLSRNRAVGIRLGQGEPLESIVSSSHQVAEGVTTAGVVVALAARFRVFLPVLTAVAQVLDGALSPKQAVADIMLLPQIEER